MQNWADSLDGKGRPYARADAAPSKTGAMVFPSTIGATNWWSPSYSPRTGLFYIPVREQGAVYFLGEDDFKEGSMYTRKPGPGAHRRCRERAPRRGRAHRSATLGIPLSGTLPRLRDRRSAEHRGWARLQRERPNFHGLP